MFYAWQGELDQMDRWIQYEAPQDLFNVLAGEWLYDHEGVLAMWLARKYTRAGLAEIGEYFGRRSHSTVISAQKRVTGWIDGQSEIELTDSRCKVDEALRRVEAQLRTA